MPIPCQGFTFTWAGTALAEVQSLEADLFGNLPVGRTTNWSSFGGEVRLFGFSITNLPTTDYGKRRRLVISGPAGTASTAGSMTFFDADCIYKGASVRATVNDAVRFAYTFTVMDTVGAPTNP